MAALRPSHTAGASPRWCGALLTALPAVLPALGHSGVRQLLVGICSLQLPPDVGSRVAAVMGTFINAAIIASASEGEQGAERAQQMQQQLAVLRGEETRAPHVPAGLARELLLQRREHLQRQLESWERAKAGASSANGRRKRQQHTEAADASLQHAAAGANGSSSGAAADDDVDDSADPAELATAAVGCNVPES